MNDYPYTKDAEVKYPEGEEKETPMWAGTLVYLVACTTLGASFHLGWNLTGLFW